MSFTIVSCLIIKWLNLKQGNPLGFISYAHISIIYTFPFKKETISPEIEFI